MDLYGNCVECSISTVLNVYNCPKKKKKKKKELVESVNLKILKCIQSLLFLRYQCTLHKKKNLFGCSNYYFK